MKRSLRPKKRNQADVNGQNKNQPTDQTAIEQTEDENELIPVSNPVMVRALFQKLKQRDKGIISLCLIYTFFMSLYPLSGVYLPGFLIREIEQAQALGGWTGATLPPEMEPFVRNGFIILAVFFVGAGLFGFISQYLSGHSYSRISYLRMDFLRDTIHKVMTMDYRYYEDASFMDKSNRVSRATQGNETGVELVYRNLFMMPASIISIILMLVVLAGASPLLIILPIASFLLMYYALNRSDKYAFSRREERSGAGRRIYSYNQLSQDFKYGKDIRLFSLERSIFAAYRHIADQFVSVVADIAKRRFRYQLLPICSQVLMTIFILVILLNQALAGTITVASFSVYLSAYVSVNLLLDQFAQNLIRTASEARYVKEMLAFLELDLNTNSGDQLLPTGDQLTIEFENVSFAYPGTDRLVLENVNLKIADGEKLALVGINGAGKTSLVKLMTGLHHPTTGRVLINGIDTRQLQADDLFRHFSIVFQQDEALSFTVAEHVAGSLVDIDREQVTAALRRTGLLEKIEAGEGGIDQTLTKVIDPNGLMLSGGETQKLMLARAIYKDAPSIILDEPTAALDALAETKIYQDFSNLMIGKTALFISHRLASTSFCDRIVLLSGGSIAEQGTHSELMQLRGAYYEMYQIQGKYYQSSSTDEIVCTDDSIADSISGKEQAAHV